MAKRARPASAKPFQDDESSDSDSQDSIELPQLSSLRNLGDAGSHQLTLERMLNPSVLFEALHETKRSRSLRTPTHGEKKSLLMTMQQAARDGRIDIVEQHIGLIGKDKKKLNRRDHEQTTALHYAVRYGHYGIVRLLVESGASVNVQGEYGATPLHYAARYVFKALRKGHGSPLLSQAASSKSAKKTKERDNAHVLRNLALLNTHKGKHSLTKNEKKQTAEKRNAVPKGLKHIVDSLSQSYRSLNADGGHGRDVAASPDGNSEQQFTSAIHTTSMTHPLLPESLPSSPVVSRSAVLGGLLIAPPSDSAGQYSDVVRVSQSSLPVQRKHFSVTSVKSVEPASLTDKMTSDGRESGLDRLGERLERANLTDDGSSMFRLSSFPNSDERPINRHQAYGYDRSFDTYRDSQVDLSTPSNFGLVATTSSDALDIPVSLKSDVTPASEQEPGTVAVADGDVGYPSDDPTVVVAGTFSHEEITGVNALIIPSICQVDVESDEPTMGKTEKRTLSLPDIHAAILSETSNAPEKVFPGTSLAKRVSVVSGRLNFKRNLKAGPAKPVLTTKKLYVGKSVAGNDYEDSAILRYLLEKKANVNARDYYGCTPLHYAAMRGNFSAARQLLTHPNVTINVEAKDRTNMTPLHCAASNGALEICELLLEHGANLRCVDEEDMTPLHFAAMEGYLEIVRLFFRVGESRGGWPEIAKMIMDHDRDEQTALHLAVENGHIDIVQACIDKGANVNFVKANLMTPLHLACTSGQLNIVQLLVEHDADVEAKNALQETPLHRAALFNRVSIVEFLLDKQAFIDCRDKDKETPLMMAVRKNNVETVQLLLDRNADVTVKDANDKTCLYLAAEEDCVDVFERLMKRPKISSLLEEFDKNENTPLHIAAMKGYIKIVKMLLGMGACIDAKNDQNLTPLHLAAKRGRSRIVKLLLTQDVSIVNDEDDASNTPLHLAALEGHVKVVKILLQCGAAVDARNANLWTPLDCAAYRGWTWCAEALLDGDSLIDPQDKAKTTPLHLACKEGHVDMVNLLLSRKADITRKDHMGRNCLDWAVDNKQREAAMAIISSENWQAAMRNYTVEGSKLTTPMRKLIKKLPDVAEKVFNQCLTGNNLPIEHPLYEITCNYEFLEDTFTEWGPSFYDSGALQLQYQEAVTRHTGAGFPNKSVQPTLWKRFLQRLNILSYVNQQSELKQNHPLKFMVRSERTKLLCHPLVTYLLRHKWRACGRYVYYSKLILYAFFLIFLTSYAMTITTEQFSVRCPGVPAGGVGQGIDANCTKVCLPVVEPVQTAKRKFFVDFGRYVVLVLASISIVLEFIKLVQQFYSYLRPHRLLEISCYILSILYVLEGLTVTSDSAPISIVQHARCTMFHRSIGALAVWLSWLCLVIFMRKFPKLGIYIVMFSHLLKTFAQFCVVVVLMVIAFGLSFHVLLYEQNPIAWRTPPRALLKTAMGMLGEFEYDVVFNDPSQTPVAVAWFIYVVYLMVNCIILMNLLIGLAVDDIKGVQERAVLKRLAMQVDLTVDVEKALPLSWQRRMATLEETIRPNTEKGFSLWSFWSFKSAAPLRSLNAQPNALERVQKQQGELKENVRGVRNKMKVLEAQSTRLETMLTAVLKHHSINVEYEVDKEEHR